MLEIIHFSLLQKLASVPLKSQNFTLLSDSPFNTNEPRNFVIKKVLENATRRKKGLFKNDNNHFISINKLYIFLYLYFIYLFISSISH